MAKVTWNSAGAIKVVKRSVSEEVIKIMEDILLEAKAECPVDTGALRDSGQVRTTAKSTIIEFTQPYARIQHENLDYHHVIGKAKYLEDPFNRNAHRFSTDVNKRVSRDLRGRR